MFLLWLLCNNLEQILEASFKPTSPCFRLRYMNPKLQWAANLYKLYYIFFNPLLCIKVNRNVLFKALRYLNILSDTTLVKQELSVTFLGKVTDLVRWMLHDSNLLKRGMLFWLHISDFRKSRAVSATLYYC